MQFFPDGELFDNNVFVINNSLQVELVETDRASITIIDNFYEDIVSVNRELSKLPITKVFNQYPDNGVTYFDGRKVYCNNMQGTQIPYTQDKSLTSKVGEYINYPESNIGVRDKILINCFQFTDEFSLTDSYYSVHEDPYKNDTPGQTAMVVFLNDHYEDGEGMNFYSKLYHDTPFHNHNSMILKKDIDLIYTVQGKCNRAVLFDSEFTHGQHTPTDQFKKEMRYTQVIFFPLY